MYAFLKIGKATTLMESSSLSPTTKSDFSYVPGDNSQFQDRVHRIGQTRDVHIFYQFFKDTQYEKMWNTVLSKSLIINQVIKKEDEK